MFEPPFPGPADRGRMAFFVVPIVRNSIPMLGWHCRWCRLGLRQVLNEQTRMPTQAVCCMNCDSPGGETPDELHQRIRRLA